MKRKELVMFLEGRRIGVPSEDRDGNHVFTCDMDAEIDASLSLSLPRRVTPWKGKPVEAFVDGVLLEDQAMRQRIARHRPRLCWGSAICVAVRREFFSEAILHCGR